MNRLSVCGKELTMSNMVELKRSMSDQEWDDELLLQDIDEGIENKNLPYVNVPDYMILMKDSILP